MGTNPGTQMRPSAGLIATLAFLAAAGLALLGAWWGVSVIENRSREAVDTALESAGFDWAEVATDGLLVTLTGKAPTEAERFRALSLAGEIVDPARVVDNLSVADAAEIAPPRFSVELLRNDDGISLIGLIPEAGGHERIAQTLENLGGTQVTDMLETANHPVPPGWDRAVDYGLAAIRTLPHSKISIDAERVAITAIAESADQKRRWEADLNRRVPPGLQVTLDISAPRPVITPFTLRFLIDEQGARFDACSADTDKARASILLAAAEAGVPGTPACTIGLGVPSPDWARAVTLGIGAVQELGGGSITFSDADVSLMATEETTQADFDRVAGELEARLPQVFSLKSVLPEKPKEAPRDGPPEFTATLADGKLQLRGRLTDEMLRDAVDSFARARFGADAVFTAARLDPALPDGWPVKVLSGLDALGELRQGTLRVQEKLVTIQGTTGNPDARAAIARILSEKLGPGAAYRLDVNYDEKLDPMAALPTPQQCVSDINAILAARKITFAPNSATIDREAGGTLDKVAEVMRRCYEVRMEIGGHTDSQGRDEMNLQLSQARAEAVLEALLARRVPISNLSARGYGETLPIASNGSDEGRETNRRIEFRLIVPGESGRAVPAPIPPAAPQVEEAAPEDPAATVGGGEEATEATPDVTEEDADLDATPAPATAEEDTAPAAPESALTPADAPAAATLPPELAAAGPQEQVEAAEETVQDPPAILRFRRPPPRPQVN